jgi:hypothetical protein
MQKICSKCVLEKPLLEFYKDRTHKDGYSSTCKPCSLQTSRQWKKENRERYKNYQLLKAYNITREQYNHLLKLQNNQCAVCEITQEQHTALFGKELAVDHDHKTGKVRGILCDKHNQALGFIGNDSEVLIRLFEYLKKIS